MSTKRKPSTWIDPDDAPAWTAADFATAEHRIGPAKATPEVARAAMAKRLRGRPKAAQTKVAVKLRLDPDIVAALRATGEGWQTRVNDALRAQLALAGQL
jgi:uncharacterized protein (DUF4415 family)